MTASEAIHCCNEFLWTHMFPSSLGYHMPFGSDQHSALVKTFMAGILTMDAKHRLAQPCLTALFDELSQDDWQPDHRFRPTSHANN